MFSNILYRRLRKSRTRLSSQKQSGHRIEQPIETVKDDSAYIKEVSIIIISKSLMKHQSSTL